MKNLVYLLVFAFSTSLLLTSCGGDDDDNCSNPAEWIGNYEIIGDTICASDPTTSFSSTLEIEASAVAETFEYEGEAFVITECTATDGLFIITKDGDKISIGLVGDECTFEFEKK